MVSFAHLNFFNSIKTHIIKGKGFGIKTSRQVVCSDSLDSVSHAFEFSALEHCKQCLKYIKLIEVDIKCFRFTRSRPFKFMCLFSFVRNSTGSGTHHNNKDSTCDQRKCFQKIIKINNKSN